MEVHVTLHWHGPFRISQDEAGLFLDSTSETLLFSKGLYLLEDIVKKRIRIWAIPLYIGMAYGKTFAEEINTILRSDVGQWIKKNAMGNIVAKVAHADLVDGERISERLVRETEDLLVALVKPLGNALGRTYGGQRTLIVYNVDKHGPLRSTMSTEML